ncbi:LANO_0A04214g1_1 [Lachancea nothofagi CBS 11611]|uniref:FAD synthase n=1 Tax=Lachancea nothofagi CBS 11611 TaxID=1266666 RepID=A0A1G4IQN5_9SACH|nr:LANO_0A04214g1_1 [Lachancea nothofagi CBS 11611]
MTLAEISERCHNITSSYLANSNGSAIVEATKEAIQITRQQFLQEVFTRWDPFGDRLSFSYNGGKDCQVLLILYLSCMWEYFVTNIRSSQYSSQYHQFPLQFLPTVYINQAETFGTLENSIESTRIRYFLSVYESPRNQTSMPEAFRNYLDVNSNTEAIIIGIRHTDPFGADLTCIQETDSGWPRFMRVQPLLHWKLANVWSLLLYSNEEICGLYEKGFTSIGGINSTVPNPSLSMKLELGHSTLKNEFEWEIMHAYGKKEASDEVCVSKLSASDERLLQNKGHLDYYPGWYMIDDSLERAGRSRS